jgi:moderate conductance mechanosensitive channel
LILPSFLRSALAVAVLVSVALTATIATAQGTGLSSASAGTPGLSTDQLRSLADTLDDPQARERLVGQLRALIAVSEGGPGEPVEAVPETVGSKTLEWATGRLGTFSRQMVTIGMAFGDVPSALNWTRMQVGDPSLRARWGELILQLAFILSGGYLSSRFVRYLVRGTRDRLGARTFASTAAKVPVLVARILLDLLPIAAFALVGFAILSVTEPQLRVRIVALTVVNATVLIQVVLTLVRFVLSPRTATLRLLPIDDEAANYAYIWARRLTYTAVYGYFIPQAAYVLGIPTGTYLGLLKFAGLLIAAMLVLIVLQNRRALADRIRGHDEAVTPEAASADAVPPTAPVSVKAFTLRGFRHRLADVWHLLAILYILVIFGIWALDISGGFTFMLRATALSVAILVVTRIVLLAVDKAIQRGFAIPEDVRREFPLMEARANRYLPWLHAGLRAFIVAVSGLTLLDAWGIESFAWLDTAWGRRVTTSAVTIGLVLMGALAAWEVVSGLIERFLAGGSKNGMKIERSARIRTLLPLLRNAFMIVLLTFVSLIVLSELGVNIAPLLAGAGVIGLAIGFGSQTLVKDVITGLFILFEDTIAVGDVVDVGGGHSGVVEAISIRTIRLRDVRGAVHTVPFSEVQTVLNMTKDFGFAVIDASIDYAEDVDRVTGVLKAIGADLQTDPQFQGSILEPIDIFGLDQFGPSAIVIRGRIKTRPGKQWAVARAYNRLMKQKFDELGISIPFPQRTVHVKGDVGALTPTQIATATGG